MWLWFSFKKVGLAKHQTYLNRTKIDTPTHKDKSKCKVHKCHFNGIGNASLCLESLLAVINY